MEYAWIHGGPNVEDFTISLIDYLLDSQRVALSETDATSDFDYVLQLCETLGLWESKENPAGRHMWNVERKAIQTLDAFPMRLPNTGMYHLREHQNLGPPMWLWDSHNSCTVAADSKNLEEGYVAVSYTWGRWQIGEKMEAGTAWEVPVVDPIECGFDISQLKTILSNIPCARFFWVDVLCINQKDPEEMSEEIAKQGAIFAEAKAVLTYLWSLRSGYELVHALCDLGDFLLSSLRISRPEIQESANSTLSASQKAQFGAQLRSDPWFTSHWALQEMILCPSAIWMTKNGEFCTVNKRIVTTSVVASACALLDGLIVLRAEILRRLDTLYDRSAELKKWTQARREQTTQLQKDIRPWMIWAKRIIPALSTLQPAARKRVKREWVGESCIGSDEDCESRESLP